MKHVRQKLVTRPHPSPNHLSIRATETQHLPDTRPRALMANNETRQTAQDTVPAPEELQPGEGATSEAEVTIRYNRCIGARGRTGEAPTECRVREGFLEETRNAEL